MARYFFDVIDGETRIDRVGTECGSPEEARAEAIVTAGEMVRDALRHFRESSEWQMIVRDEERRPFLNLRFSAEPALP
ncbi:DUF6894 family protein [Methylorubrum extorquens]